MLSFTARKRIRNQFGKIKDIATMPNLIEVQKNSYDKFLGKDEDPEGTGLESIFRSVFPVNDFADTSTLEFVSYKFGEPKYDVEESRQRGINFSAPLYATLRLIVWVVDEDSGTREIKDIKEQDVYMGDIPMMTGNGTFIINGTERVIVSQMHRSPGVFFDHDKGKTHSSGKFLYNCRVIPYRGSWLDLEFDGKDLLYFRIDRRRKLHASSLLRALGMDTEEILNTFYQQMQCKKSKKGWIVPFDAERMKGMKLDYDVVDPKTGKVKVEAGTKITAKTVRDLNNDGFSEQLVKQEQLAGRYVALDMVNVETGEIYIEAGEELTEDKIEELVEAGFNEIPTLNIDNVKIGSYLRDSLAADKNQSREEALIDVYKVMRPGEPPTVEAAETLFQSLFFDRERYDLSDVGRMKMNARLGLEVADDVRVLTKEDIIEAVRTLISIKDGFDDVDDIDHLGNRRIRSVGELVENQFRIGLLRMERAVTERMSSVEIDTVMPQDLINSKPLVATIKEFFGSSQLSQFMDQTNPLSEITHKRRLSALGPGGLTRERAGFEVRDVHVTHYGRMCPIETPEGPNIGLINSMATYAKVNKYGFIDTPYRKVKDSKVTDEVVYLSAIEEGKYTIAQANAEVDSKGKLTSTLVSSRKKGDFTLSSPDEIDYIDVSPKQLVSVAASLIPFLENDDANRALMGSNMQRQAVPLLRAEAPFVGTGMESVVAKDSGVTVVSKNDGVVDQVDAMRIVVRSKPSKKTTSPTVDIYNLQKYQRSNQDTCINQKPLVKVGDEVKAGDILADGTSTELGELALGRNVLVAFMPWKGYNFEDSILISERIVKDDVFTSIHIEEFEVMARDTKLGPEEITRDIPNVGEESLRHLDEVGVVHVGAEVRPGDILVGKVTPKSESPVTPEEKLLRAIFGEKAADVRDSSLKLPPGVAGTIVDIRIFSRRGVEKDERALQIEREQIERLRKDRNDERNIVERFVYGHLEELLKGKEAIGGPKGFKAGTKIDEKVLEKYTRSQWFSFVIDDQKAMNEIEGLKNQFDEKLKAMEDRFSAKVEKVQSGDDLPPGVLKVVKVFVAVKRKLQPGDKMAGRHGNKGVISRIVPIEDMPYLEDGTPVDVVLNPLGVPSRMNIGQIMETHLGWAAHGLGRKIGNAYEQYKKKGIKESDLQDEIADVYESAEVRQEIKTIKGKALEELAKNLSNGVPQATPVFDGAKEHDIVRYLEKAGLHSSGQMVLRNGLTGEPFERKVTVGYVYMLKLHHLVDDKIHARSIGPYSLVTQQPLGGKSHFGGQRFGEMECWALQAYGAAHTLQEILTVKSDDVTGRTKVYESIVRGDHSFEPGIPESFNVIVKELRGLGLNVELNTDEKEVDEEDSEGLDEAA
ncbi:MAG: DNA-directed RNA polymerase subunit beta [Alphaproteobacteria bacterium CG11_big_fil_rev_8_21_14_0_20_44_7]|nr:MAG: DNA-directed RNA polymerase subunit beta [Alphaproteobacteria bacterium CG11_big_fil_rev_8_21_14_0_20_44_7]